MPTSHIVELLPPSVDLVIATPRMGRFFREIGRPVPPPGLPR